MENGCLKIFESSVYVSSQYVSILLISLLTEITPHDLMENENKGRNLLHLMGP